MPRLRLAVATTAAALAMTASIALPAAAAPASAQRGGTGPQYYLSLGDSLAAGEQPNAQGVSVPTDQGYADQLNAMLQIAHPGLHLAKLGCPLETTATLINGGICGYTGDELTSLTGDEGSQLAAALAFLQAHSGQVRLITIGIGANDMNPCIALGSIAAIAACAPRAIQTAAANLTTILAELHAADPQAVIVGMNYFIPQLAAWLTGPSGQAFAEGAIQIAEGFNAAEAAAYTSVNAPVADVFDAFRSTDFSDQVPLPGHGLVPENVALVCEWTWECAAPPVGPNDHANAIGYGVMALAARAVLPTWPSTDGD